MANKYEKPIEIWAWGPFAQIASKAIELSGSPISIYAKEARK